MVCLIQHVAGTAQHRNAPEVTLARVAQSLSDGHTGHRVTSAITVITESERLAAAEASKQAGTKCWPCSSAAAPSPDWSCTTQWNQLSIEQTN